ncbi:HNH endonuclease [Candidatus Woesearchaeota archaeon]|nr:HNH endonuclease [Candidatus Woesearchaeota archaeon]
MDNNGYRCFADSCKQVSRWAAEQKIGRPLKDDEVVHHGFKGKLCNHPDNLWVCKNQSKHMRTKHRR